MDPVGHRTPCSSEGSCCRGMDLEDNEDSSPDSGADALKAGFGLVVSGSYILMPAAEKSPVLISFVGTVIREEFSVSVR